MKKYKAGVIGCGRMGGFIDNEWVGGPLEPKIPHAHAAVYEANERIDLVACCDPREDVLEQFGERYNVPPNKRYTDFREMLRREQLDIVSITTQPEHRAEIIVAACEEGTRALFCEKALCASLEEADRIVDVVKRHRVVFNMGTSRRWETGYERMKELVKSGELGTLDSIIIYRNGTLFNTGSHGFDLAQWLNDDVPASWVQAHLPNGDSALDGHILRKDPLAEGIIQFENGVTAYALNTRRPSEFEVVCTKGTVTSINNGQDWMVRRTSSEHPGQLLVDEEPFSNFTRTSSNVRLVDDLVAALDTGGKTRGGVDVAHANQELIAAFIESHRRGGARVTLPLAERHIRLMRDGSSELRGREIRL